MEAYSGRVVGKDGEQRAVEVRISSFVSDLFKELLQELEGQAFPTSVPALLRPPRANLPVFFPRPMPVGRPLPESAIVAILFEVK
jgi:hypothetical protein